jgi:thiamine transport system substrate-binding protein
MAWLRITALVLAAALFVAACADSAPDSSEVALLTHDSFLVSDGVLEAFTEETGITVTVLRSGDAGVMVNQAILTKDNPIADVLYGIDNTFLSRALDEELFVLYQAAGIDRVPAALHVVADAVTPIDFGDVCINTDIGGLDSIDVTAPVSLLDLTDPAYRGLFVVEDPSTSSPGLAFLLATVETFGEEGDYTWRDYWADLVANDVLITQGWEEAYNLEFSGGSGTGTRPLVVSYASSPPAEVFYGGLDEAPTGVVTAGCFRQIEYAGILAGTPNEPAARQLVDYLLSIPFQEDIPLNMFVFPANVEAQLPEVFVEHATLPADPVTMSPDRIDANRERWIDEWAQIVR